MIESMQNVIREIGLIDTENKPVINGYTGDYTKKRGIADSLGTYFLSEIALELTIS
jgi:hypothetical protein